MRTASLRYVTVLALLAGALGTLPASAKNKPDPADHWAWKPIVKPELPTVRDRAWSQSPIDRFIYDRLKNEGLKPSKRADTRTLVRRARFDLLGLPPSYDEVRAVETSSGEDAWARLIDRYLAMPEYGERWGRHWLDVARYADTKGYVFEEEERFAFSYTYRDYVIGAFNEDLPFNRFILEQIAADKLESSDAKPLAAMGFLTVGDRFRNGRHEIIDDQIDVVTRGFMGLTVACARCHDHKYDPIPIEDYYSLYGVFASSEEAKGMEMPVIGSPANDAQYQAFVNKMTELQQGVKSTTAQVAKEARKQAIDQVELYLEEVILGKNTKGIPLRRHSVKTLRDMMKSPPAPLQSVLKPLDQLRELPENDFSKASVALISRFSDGKAPVNPRLLEVLTAKPLNSKGEAAAAVAGLFMDVRNQWRAELKKNSKVEALADTHLEQVRQVMYSSSGPISLPDDQMVRSFGQVERQRLNNAQKKVHALIATHSGAPPRAMTVRDRGQMHEPRVFRRGNANTPGETVPRQFISLLTGSDRKPFSPDSSGRLELARAVARPDNPLTARVIVNRVWQWHFGTGLVASSSNFGILGERPSHPELLDYLAATFIEDGWSIKDLHRRIMLSETYRQRSAVVEKARAVDPENRLLWRFPPRRLDFESTRDALLAVSGKLNRRRGGHSVDLLKQPYSGRRTVYGFIDRLNPPKTFRDFDMPAADASIGVRPTTTVPQQALFLINSAFAIEQARALAARVKRKHPTERSNQVDELYRLAYARLPEAKERERAVAFLSSAKAKKSFTPLEQLGQVILCANEFVFVD